MSKVTAEYVRSILRYERSTGLFRWRHDHRWNAKAGSIAGSIHAHGYRIIKIDGVGYPAHRLAWLVVNGYFPDCEIDHKNRIRSDNRFRNLREATRTQNTWNAKIKTTSSTGHRGVSKRRGRWLARIQVHKRRIHLGYFDTADKARRAYAAAAKDFHGSFANCS